MCLWTNVMMISTNDSWNNDFKRSTTPDNRVRKTLCHFLLNLFVQLQPLFHRNESANTSSDSGVNSPQVLSPAMPVTPDHLQSFPMPSTSRMPPSSGPLTPIQQFINNSRISKAKEPKYNRSQPDHPDSQSVLRTRTRQGYKL